MKYLITGVLGFIGSYLAKYIIRTIPKSTVVGVGRHTVESHKKRLEDLWENPRFQMIWKDFARDDISEIFEGVDYCLNLGGKTFVDHSVISPDPFVESNVIGTYKMLKEAIKSKTLIKYIQMSTDEVYGPILEGKQKECNNFNPTNPYSNTKAQADLNVYMYNITYKLPTIIVRAENVYGPYQHPQKVIPAWTKRALNGEPLLIYGDGKHSRMWLYVEDCCRALVHLCKVGYPGEIYHIAGEEELENVELAIRILRILGTLPDTITDPLVGDSAILMEGKNPTIVNLKRLKFIKFIPDKDIRPFHDRRYALDVSKLKATGWERKYDLEDGLRQTVNWFKKHRWWVQ